MLCPLCSEQKIEFILLHRHREFHKCIRCELVFVPSAFHLTILDEKNEYDRHENDSGNEGYVSFLNRAIIPLREVLKPGMEGLDFGSGPGPVLSQMLNEEGYPTLTWDPIYAPDESALKRQYDFVTSTEVVEHFCNPHQGWQKLSGLLRNGGYLSVMTLLRDESTDLESWWYKNDPTHVSFYSIKTINWIEKGFNLKLIFQDEDRVLLFKKEMIT